MKTIEEIELELIEFLDLAKSINEKLKGFASKDHKHTEYAEATHKHDEYAPKKHTHKGYALDNHKHEEYAPKEHTHKGYAQTEHKHPELEAAIRGLSTLVIRESERLDIDELKTNIPHQCILKNTGNTVHIQDYIRSDNKVLFNCQNLIIAAGKRFAVRICRTEKEAFVLFDGIINE